MSDHSSLKKFSNKLQVEWCWKK